MNKKMITLASVSLLIVGTFVFYFNSTSVKTTTSQTLTKQQAQVELNKYANGAFESTDYRIETEYKKVGNKQIKISRQIFLGGDGDPQALGITCTGTCSGNGCAPRGCQASNNQCTTPFCNDSYNTNGCQVSCSRSGGAFAPVR